VPVEPEQEMLDAAYDAQGYQARQGMRAAWAAMLAAAPTPPADAVTGAMARAAIDAYCTTADSARGTALDAMRAAITAALAARGAK
jgi:hypothetical protein